MILGDIAYCDSDECKVLSWDTTKSIDELLSHIHLIDLANIRIVKLGEDKQ